MKSCLVYYVLPMNQEGFVGIGRKWSVILSHERVAEIVQDVTVLQYADNVLIGAASLEELRSIALRVFERID